jgi:pimeloyl-ACP methyl ester carboxylesterase
VLAPTLGIEAVSAHHAYRYLADRLAAVGFLTLRFDYDGTGDSAGRQDDPDRVVAWLGSLHAAAAFMRGMGPERMSLVGMRVGATLCTEAFGSGPVAIDDLVLWDPCASGRSFLREQSVLWSVALGTKSHDDGSIETPGLVYDKETVEELSAVAIADGDGSLAERVLLLMRSGRNGDRRMNERLDMPNVERMSISGQEDLVDVLPHATVMPEATIATIVNWLAARFNGEPMVRFDEEAMGRNLAIVGRASDGVSIDERPMTFGPKNLFGITTTRHDAAQSLATPAANGAELSATKVHTAMPTIFLFNAGEIDHVGPARLWVTLARRWAEAGFRVIRFDLVGVGDSPIAEDQIPHVVYSPDALDDILDVLRAASPDEPSNAVLVGLCSGAYHAVEGAIAGKVRGLIAVNPSLSIKPPEVNSKAPPELQSGTLDSRRQASGATKGWARALPAHDKLGPFVESLPGPAWWIINRIAVESPPARTLTKVIESGVNLFVLAGDREAHLLKRGEGRTMRRLRQNSLFRMDVIPDLEHSLFEWRGRLQATELLTEHLVGCYGAPFPEA